MSSPHAHANFPFLPINPILYSTLRTLTWWLRCRFRFAKSHLNLGFMITGVNEIQNNCSNMSITSGDDCEIWAIRHKSFPRDISKTNQESQHVQTDTAMCAPLKRTLQTKQADKNCYFSTNSHSVQVK